MSESLPRTVIESDVYEKHRQGIWRDTKTYDVIFRGLEWALATDPESFPLVPETDLHIALLEPVGDVPECAVFFKHNHERVELIDIQVI